SSGFDERCDGRILSATTRSRRVSVPRYTSPMPPAPIGATTSYGPRRVPAAIAIECCDYRRSPQRHRGHRDISVLSVCSVVIAYFADTRLATNLYAPETPAGNSRNQSYAV